MQAGVVLGWRSMYAHVLNAAGWIANCSRVLLALVLLLRPLTLAGWLWRWGTTPPLIALAWAAVAAAAAAGVATRHRPKGAAAAAA